MAFIVEYLRLIYGKYDRDVMTMGRTAFLESKCVSLLVIQASIVRSAAPCAPGDNKGLQRSVRGSGYNERLGCKSQISTAGTITSLAINVTFSCNSFRQLM